MCTSVGPAARSSTAKVSVFELASRPSSNVPTAKDVLSTPMMGVANADWTITRTASPPNTSDPHTICFMPTSFLKPIANLPSFEVHVHQVGRSGARCRKLRKSQFGRRGLAARHHGWLPTARQRRFGSVCDCRRDQHCSDPGQKKTSDTHPRALLWGCSTHSKVGSDERSRKLETS